MCAARNVPESEIIALTSEVLGHDSLARFSITKHIEKVISYPDQKLEFFLSDGRSIIKEWKVPTRKNSWTPEMKLQASLLAKEKRKARKVNDEKNKSNTGYY